MIVYKTTNLINGKFYVGKDMYNNSNYIGSGKILKLAIKKYGRENFKKEILEKCNFINQLNKREVYWIKKLKSLYPIGYNIAIGNNGISSDTLSNNPNKRDIFVKRTINNPGMYDRIKETRIKNGGYIVSDETRKGVSEYSKNRPQDILEKLSKASIGNNSATKKRMIKNINTEEKLSFIGLNELKEYIYEYNRRNKLVKINKVNFCKLRRDGFDKNFILINKISVHGDKYYE